MSYVVNKIILASKFNVKLQLPKKSRGEGDDFFDSLWPCMDQGHKKLLAKVPKLGEGVLQFQKSVKGIGNKAK
jgi:hypothetical protein